MAQFTCWYCDELMPYAKYNTHLRAKHTPPSSQDMARYFRKFGPAQQSSRSRQVAATPRQNPANPSPVNARAGTANDTSMSTSFSNWHQDNVASANIYAESITAEQISSFSVDRSDQPKVTAEYLQKSAKFDIQGLVRKFNGLQSEEWNECDGLVRELPVFACLGAYVFTHLNICAREKPALLDAFRNKTQEWVREGDRWCLLHYDSIKSDLSKFLEESEVQVHKCNAELLSGASVHPLDIRSLAALAIIYSSDKDRAESFYSMKNDQAQSMVDLLQALIDVKGNQLDSWYQRRFLDAVIRLSKKSRHYPRSLKITGVKDVSSTDHRGGFGAIFLGKLSGKVVALKELQAAGRTSEQFLKDFCQETVVWRNVHHINCLPFYGVATVSVDGMPRTCMVSPWMENGNLHNYIKENPSIPRLPLLLDIADGLLYLHTMQPTIVHGDLKCLNIFVTASGRACLADFGLATAHDEQGSVATTTLNVYGTAGYMAPELLKLTKNPEPRQVLDFRRCDMFAFGCIMYEVYTSKPPVLGSPSVRNDALRAGIRPAFPNDAQYRKLGLDEDMWSFIESLWADRPETRLVAQSARDFLSYKMTNAGQSVARRMDEDSEWDTTFLSSLVVASDPFAL